MKKNEKVTETLVSLRKKHVPQGPFNTGQVFIREARGAVMIDVEGREIVDFTGGIGVNNVGHCHPKIVKAIQDQAAKYIHTCFHVAMYEPYVELAAKLNELTPGEFPKMTMFTNSGAESVENAVKIARYAAQRPAVICFENAFHGRTLLAMSLTSKVKPYKFGFGPLVPEIYRAPSAYCYRCTFGLRYPSCNVACADYIEEMFVSHVAPESTAAVIAEPIQGEGGFITPPQEYFGKVHEICKKYGILLIIDEVQTGMGRTGPLFGIEHWGIQPDLITLAKSLGGGMPLGSVTGRKEVMDKPHVGGLGGTYSGNPVSCRAALAVLEILLEDGLLARAVQLGDTLLPRFLEFQRRYEVVGDVRGKGPMLAMELVKDRETKIPATEETKSLIGRCWERGLALITCGSHSNVIRTLMPLVITDDQLEKGLEILESSLNEIGR
jgi:4-aminobutyrate aminotransferase/(S)-3-amino-2-methylpropionate transaminase